MIRVVSDLEGPCRSCGELCGDTCHLLAALGRMLAARPLEPEPGRLALRKAVTALARADGLPATRAALRRVAVEALAWERRLPNIVHDVAGVDVPHEEGRAA